MRLTTNQLARLVAIAAYRQVGPSPYYAPFQDDVIDRALLNRGLIEVEVHRIQRGMLRAAEDVRLCRITVGGRAALPA